MTTSYLTMVQGSASCPPCCWRSLLAVVIGLLQGALIARLGVAPFVITLGSMLFLRGVAEVLTGGSEIGFQGKFPGLRFLGEGNGLGLPMPFWFALVAVAVTAFVMHRTIFGRYCYAIGSNAEAARLSGVPVTAVRLATYVASALLAGVAGILWVAYLPAASPALGNSWELYAVAAAVLGGCSLQGGRGSVFGVLVGAGVVAPDVQLGEPRAELAVAERGSRCGDSDSGHRRPLVRKEIIQRLQALQGALRQPIHESEL